MRKTRPIHRGVSRTRVADELWALAERLDSLAGIGSETMTPAQLFALGIATAAILGARAEWLAEEERRDADA